MRRVPAVEVTQIDFNKVTEALVRQEDFGTGIHARDPRGTALAFHHVDEAGFGAARFLHQVEEAGDVSVRGARLEHHRVVGLLAVEVVVDPEVLLRLCKFSPLRIAKRNQCNLSRAP